MMQLKKVIKGWSQDRILGSILRNSGALFSSNTATFVFSNIQGLITPLILGVEGYGFIGIVTTFANNVNRFFSFRLNDLVVTFAGDYLDQEDYQRAGAVIKFSALIETITSLLAFLVLLLIAPLAPDANLHPEIVNLIYVYSFALLANFSFETFNSVLRIRNKFDQIAKINFIQGLITALLILILFITKGNLLSVLLAYLIGKVYYGLTTFYLGQKAISETLGKNWWKASLRSIENKKDLIKFAFSTNISQTINLLFRDSELLIIAYLTSATGAAYYKFALALINPVMFPINALNSTVFPEINRAILLKKWTSLKSILKKTSMIAFGWMAFVSLVVVTLGPIGFRIYKSGEFYPSFYILLVLLAGYFIANIFYWNRDLLLSFNKPNIPLIVLAIVGVIKTILVFILVPRYGFVVQAGLLSAYLAISISIIALIGVRLIKNYENQDKILTDENSHNLNQ